MSKLFKYGASILFILIPTLSNAQNAISQIAERILPAIVVVNTATGNGSGVIVDDSGVIATNYHVIEDSSNVSIELQNGDVYQDIGVISIDEIKDIALLKIDGFDLPTAEFGNSNSVVIGEDVLVMGAPRGMEQTVSRGIVSAIRDSGEGYRLIQTDAAISPGSSGGGMFNLEGELVGLTVSYLEDAQNINFVIPINYVRGMFSTTESYPLADLAINNPPERNSGASNASVASSLDSVMEELNEEYNDTFAKIDNRWYLLDEDFVLWNEIISDDIIFTTLYDESINSDLTEKQFREILQANYVANFSKIGIDEDGDIVITNEIKLENAKDDYLMVLGSMFSLQESLQAIANTSQNLNRKQNKRELNYTQSTNDIEVKYNDDQFTFVYDKSKWKEQPLESLGNDDAKLYLLGEGDTYVTLIPETSELTFEYMEEAILANMTSVDSDAEITEKGFRTINDTELMWAYAEAQTDGINLTFYYHIYTGSAGTIQIVAWTTSNIFERKIRIIDELVAGLTVN